jgi:hypothetical protein
MAKIINIPISGKVGLEVDMPGRYGQVRRSWVIPANPNTAGQNAVRARLTECIGAFKALTQNQQNQWNLAAHSQMSRSRLGMSGPLTGLQLYTKLNTTLLLLGQERIDVPPGTTVLGISTPQALNITNTAGVIALKLTVPASPGENTIVRASAPVSSAVRRVPSLVVLGTCPAPVVGVSDITALYAAKFSTPPVGSQVFATTQLTENGYLGPVSTFSKVVPAAA